MNSLPAPITAISLFAGAGGLDLGCEEAGFATVAAVEQAGRARQTLIGNRRRHFPHLTPDAIFKDVVGLDHAELLEAAGVREAELDLLHGGPPCTPFSKSGNWLEYKRAGEDEKASLLDNYAELLSKIRPKAFLMENVYGLAYQNQNRPIFERFVRRVRRAGYTFDREVLLAADYGVPQLRQRLICVGIREDLLDRPGSSRCLGWLEPTHAGPHEARKNWRRDRLAHVSVGDALAGLTAETNPAEPEEIVDGTYAEELIGVPPGDNYLFWTAKRGHPHPRFEWRKRYWNFLLKLHPERPSPTIQGQPGPWVGPFHWESRRLRVAEVKRLMTFPDDFVVHGTRREQQLQLGNAVPPRFAAVIAGALRHELERIGAIKAERSSVAAA